MTAFPLSALAMRLYKAVKYKYNKILWQISPCIEICQQFSIVFDFLEEVQ
jgi:hypothetical protein